MSGDGGYTRVLPVHSTCRAAAMPPSQNAGSSGSVRSSLVMRKIGASACGLVTTERWPCTTAFGVAVLPEV